jgi:hypothetical protein
VKKNRQKIETGLIGLAAVLVVTLAMCGLSPTPAVLISAAPLCAFEIGVAVRTSRGQRELTRRATSEQEPPCQD